MTKEEKKDEMKNRISMALKDPILQQGFEIICKENEQIEHLREERNYFQEKCEDIELNYYCDHKGGCKVQELEKEFQDGAEYGYNKAKVEVEEKYKETLCNSELNLASVTEQLEELEKANEWHYVKDGKPKELHDVLCFVVHNEHRYVLQGYLRDGRWILSPLGTYLNNDDVIAWKEIVLPELPKGE